MLLVTTMVFKSYTITASPRINKLSMTDILVVFVNACLSICFYWGSVDNTAFDETDKRNTPVQYIVFALAGVLEACRHMYIGRRHLKWRVNSPATKWTLVKESIMPSLVRGVECAVLAAFIAQFIAIVKLDLSPISICILLHNIRSVLPMSIAMIASERMLHIALTQCEMYDKLSIGLHSEDLVKGKVLLSLI